MFKPGTAECGPAPVNMVTAAREMRALSQQDDAAAPHARRSRQPTGEFWIECTRIDTTQIYHVNISLVGGM
jgi:hypothetical protein